MPNRTEVVFWRYPRERRILHFGRIGLKVVDGKLRFWAKYKGGDSNENSRCVETQRAVFA